MMLPTSATTSLAMNIDEIHVAWQRSDAMQSFLCWIHCSLCMWWNTRHMSVCVCSCVFGISKRRALWPVLNARFICRYASCCHLIWYDIYSFAHGTTITLKQSSEWQQHIIETSWAKRVRKIVRRHLWPPANKYKITVIWNIKISQ